MRLHFPLPQLCNCLIYPVQLFHHLPRRLPALRLVFSQLGHILPPCPALLHAFPFLLSVPCNLISEPYSFPLWRGGPERRMGYKRPPLTFSDDRLSPRSTRLVTKGSFEDVPDVTLDAVQIVDIDPVGSRTSFYSNDIARVAAVSMASVRIVEHIQFTNIGRNRTEHSTPLNHLPCLSFLIEHTTRQRSTLHVVFSPKTHSWHVSNKPTTTKQKRAEVSTKFTLPSRSTSCHFTPAEVITNLEATQS